MLNLTSLNIRPMTYDKPQRVAASALATALGQGLRMELGSSTTHYYADPSVEVGKVAVYAPREYKGYPEYVTTLASATEEWKP